MKLSQPYLCCLFPSVQPPDIKTTCWYNRCRREKETKVFEVTQLGPCRQDGGRKARTDSHPGVWMEMGDGKATHFPKEKLPLHPQGKDKPAGTVHRTQECFKTKTDYRGNHNRINIFRELGYPEKTSDK